MNDCTPHMYTYQFRRACSDRTILLFVLSSLIYHYGIVFLFLVLDCMHMHMHACMYVPLRDLGVPAAVVVVLATTLRSNPLPGTPPLAHLFVKKI
jgi:hypothetical protein